MPPLPVTRTRALLAGSAAVVFWGASFVWIKQALVEAQPVTVIVVRFAIGLLVLTPLTAGLEGLQLADGRRLPELALLGFLGVAAHQWLQTHGLLTASASAASWLSALAPGLMALLAWPMLKERLTVGQGAGLALALAGALLVSYESGSVEATGAARLGAAMLLASALFWATASLVGKAQTARLGPLRVTLYAMAFGWLFSLPEFVLRQGWRDLARLSPAAWLALLLLGVASTGLAYGLYFYALRGAEAALVAALQYLEPLITMGLAAMWLHESVRPERLLGGGLILAGVWLVDHAGRTGRGRT